MSFLPLGNYSLLAECSINIDWGRKDPSHDSYRVAYENGISSLIQIRPEYSTEIHDQAQMIQLIHDLSSEYLIVISYKRYCTHISSSEPRPMNSKSSKRTIAALEWGQSIGRRSYTSPYLWEVAMDEIVHPVSPAISLNSTSTADSTPLLQGL